MPSISASVRTERSRPLSPPGQGSGPPAGGAPGGAGGVEGPPVRAGVERHDVVPSGEVRRDLLGLPPPALRQGVVGTLEPPAHVAIGLTVPYQQQPQPAGSSRPLRPMTSEYQRALAFGMRL